MPPARERMAAWRSKLSDEKKLELKAKDRARKQAARAAMSAAARKIESEKSKIRVKRMRQKKKTGCLTVKMPFKSSTFKSPQSLGKAVKKVKEAMPKSPNKRHVVMRKIASDFGLVARDSQGFHSYRGLPQETKDAVTQFYVRDDISRQAPGRKDCITIRTSDGDRQQMQKHFMNFTISETHRMFLEEYDSSQEIHVGLSKFAELRPKNVMLQSQTPANVCVCQYHANIKLMLNCVKAAGFPCRCRDLIELVVCDPSSEICMSGTCKNCGSMEIFDTFVQQYEDSNAQEVTWYQWEVSEEKKIFKVVKEGSLWDAICELRAQIPYFLVHSYLMEKQSSYFQHLKQCTSPTKGVLQVDFSENFQIAFQDEVQSAHWTNNQVSLYTAVAWVNGEVHSYAVGSDYMNHDKYAVHVFHEKILADLKCKHASLEEIDIFSDGASQHFKQKYTLSNITYGPDDHGLKINWHFFPTSHGKGAADGVGGSVKRQVWKGIKSNKFHVSNSLNFISNARAVTDKITLYHVSQDEILEKKPFLDGRWNNVLALPQTHSIHSVQSVANLVVKYGKQSSGDMNLFHFVDGHIDHVDDNGDGHTDHVDDHGEVREMVVEDSYKFGDWLVVEFESQCSKRKLHFVGQIIGQTESIEVSFVRKKESKFFWPDPADISIIDIRQVKAKLEEPATGKRGYLTFVEDLSYFNM